MKLIITEEEKSRILGMHKSATARQYLIEQADITKQVEVGFNQILTTLRNIKMLPGTNNIPVTFGNLVKDTSNTDPNVILYNVKATIGGVEPEEFVIKVGKMINVSDPSKTLGSWQNTLVNSFTTGINDIEDNSRNWATLKKAILPVVQNVKLTPPPQKPGVKQ